MARPGREPTGRPPGRPKGRAPIKWQVIEDAYVQGLERRVEGRREHYWPTLQEMMEPFGVGFRTLQEQCRKRDWVKMREAFKAKIDDEMAAKLAENLAGSRRRLEAERIVTATDIILAMREVARREYFPKDREMPADAPTPPAFVARSKGAVEESPSVELRNLGASARALLDGMMPLPMSSLPAATPASTAPVVDAKLEAQIDKVVDKALEENATPPQDGGAQGD